jgi:Glycosyltransferase family 87
VLLFVRRRPDLVTAAVLAVTGLSIVASYLLKVPCTGPTYDYWGVSANLGKLKYSNLCYSDVQQLWIGRNIPENVFPYIHGQLLPGDGPPGVLVNGAIEYPVVTGVFMWVAGLFAHTDAQFLLVNSLMLAPFGLLTGWLLAQMTSRRALLWAAAPALVIYGVYNWDFLATTCVVGAAYAWYRKRTTGAAALLGLGAAVKIYPGFFVLPLIIERLSARDVRGAGKAAGAAAGVWLAINLPVYLANPDGWWATYKFQAGRKPDLTTNSIWYWGFPKLSTEQVDRYAIALIGVTWIAALWYGWRRKHTLGSYPWIQVSGAMLCAFLAFNKVYSPQYILWVLPFLVLIRVRWGWWVAYAVIDVVLFVGLYRWYYDITLGGDFGPAKQAAVVGVWGKTVLLCLLYVVFLRSPLAAASASWVRLPPKGHPDALVPGSGAPSSTPPAGSSGSTPSSNGARTGSEEGLSTSRITSTQ